MIRSSLRKFRKASQNFRSLRSRLAIGNGAGELRAKVLAKRRKARLGDALIAQSCIDRGIPLLTRKTGTSKRSLMPRASISQLSSRGAEPDTSSKQGYWQSPDSILTPSHRGHSALLSPHSQNRSQGPPDANNPVACLSRSGQSRGPDQPQDWPSHQAPAGLIARGTSVYPLRPGYRSRKQAARRPCRD